MHDFFSFNFSLRGVAKVNSLLALQAFRSWGRRERYEQKKKAVRGEGGSLVIV